MRARILFLYTILFFFLSVPAFSEWQRLGLYGGSFWQMNETSDSAPSLWLYMTQIKSVWDMEKFYLIMQPAVSFASLYLRYEERILPADIAEKDSSPFVQVTFSPGMSWGGYGESQGFSVGINPLLLLYVPYWGHPHEGEEVSRLVWEKSWQESQTLYGQASFSYWHTVDTKAKTALEMELSLFYPFAGLTGKNPGKLHNTGISLMAGFCYLPD